jgi:hypothetical protein
MPNEEIKISAKDLGAMALEDFCPRCWWLKQKCKSLPWQIFPSVFIQIDTWTKNVVHAHIERTGKAPEWMPHCEKIIGYQKVPHWSKFQYRDQETGITIRGTADDILTCKDSSEIIVDYKTAKYTATQDKLLPMYRVQVNGYALIRESTGEGYRVAHTPMIYCEPVTDVSACTERIYHADGFDMGFTVKALEIERNFQEVRDLLKKAKGILESPIPFGAPGCKDCEKLDAIISLVANG